MKKVAIGVAVAAVIGVGVYLGKQQVGDAVADVAETQVTEFINNNLNKPIVIEELQSHPFIKTATLTITEKTDTTIRSELTLTSIEDDSETIPLNSEIIRGKVDYKGKSFGFGKIITKPDLSGFGDDLPKGITNDTFSLEQYIDLLGNVSEIYRIAPVQVKEGDGAIDFKGIEALVDTTLLNRSAFDGTFSIKGLDVSGPKGKKVVLSPFDYQIKLASSGNYTASSTPINFVFSNPMDDDFSIAFSKGTYSGIYKIIDGLDMPINNGNGLFDSVTFGDDKLKITINHLKVSGGLYEIDGSDTNNLSAAISGDFDAASLPKQLPTGEPMPVKLKSFALNYAFDNISKETLNLYQQTVNSFGFEEELSEEQIKTLVSALQKSDAQFKLTANVTAEEGKTDADASLALNEEGKAADFETLAAGISRDTAAKFFNGDLFVTMDKEFADATNLTMMAQMFLGITPENNQLTLKAELKDGQATMNGQAIPLN